MNQPIDRRKPPGFGQLAKEFIMGDLPPAHQRIVTGFLGRLTARSIFALFVVWALGFDTYVGLSPGFARAEDTDAKIEAAVKPMQKDIAELKIEQRRTSAQVESILRLNLEQRLRDLERQKCDSDPRTAQRRLIDQNIRDTQHQYRAINSGQDYTIPSCSDL